jgi:hypothetical protein
MANKLRHLIAAIACAPSVLFAQTNHPAKERETGEILLNPSAIRITGHFEIAPGLTTLERALRALTQQMEQKRAEDAARSPLAPLWEHPLWKYLPADPGGTLNSPVGALPDNLARNPLHLDDPFRTPAYLTFRGRQLDYDLARSEKSARWFMSQ